MRAPAPRWVWILVHARHRRHGGAQLDRRAGWVGEMQRAALVQHLDERRGDAGAIEMRFGLVEVLVGEHPHADALALRLAAGALEREAVVAALLYAAQPDRVGGLVAHDQAQDLDIEVAAGGEIDAVKTRWLARVMLNGGLKLVCGMVTAASFSWRANSNWLTRFLRRTGSPSPENAMVTPSRARRSPAPRRPRA